MTNNYHSIMSRFQVSASAVPITAGPGPLPIYSSSPPIQQIGGPPYLPPGYTAPGYPLYTVATPNLTVSNPQSHQSQPQSQPPNTVPAPVIADVTPQKDNPNPSTPDHPTAATTQSPETPSKRESMKSIEFYFVSFSRKPTIPLANKVQALVSASEINPNPLHAMDLQSTASDPEPELMSNISPSGSRSKFRTRISQLLRKSPLSLPLEKSLVRRESKKEIRIRSGSCDI